MCSVFIKYFKVWLINMYKKENNVSAVVLFFLMSDMAYE